MGEDEDAREYDQNKIFKHLFVHRAHRQIIPLLTILIIDVSILIHLTTLKDMGCLSRLNSRIK